MPSSNLFTLLHESHTIQRRFARKLLRPSHTDRDREELFLQLKVELEAHAAAEERFLYVPLLMTDPGLGASRHALSEHHEIEEQCEDLSVRRKGGAAWMKGAHELSQLVHHHLKEEESKFFKVGGRILSDRAKAKLATGYQRELIRMRKMYASDYETVTVAAAGTVERKRAARRPS